jgi:hypothetical protein
MADCVMIFQLFMVVMMFWSIYWMCVNMGLTWKTVVAPHPSWMLLGSRMLMRPNCSSLNIRYLYLFPTCVKGVKDLMIKVSEFKSLALYHCWFVWFVMWQNIWNDLKKAIGSNCWSACQPKIFLHQLWKRCCITGID